MNQPTNEERLQRLLEQTEIFDLVRVERFYRDQRDWDGLIGSYVKHAPVRTTWFDGSIEDFVEASRRKMTGPGASAAKHWIFPTALQLNGERALIESPAAIFDRLTFDGVEFDSFQYCRFVSRLVRTAAGWRLAVARLWGGWPRSAHHALAGRRGVRGAHGLRLS